MRILLFVFVLFCTVNSNGQDILDFRMNDVFFGNVKSVEVTEPEMAYNVSFYSEDGKITRMQNNLMRIDYEWNGDEIKCTLYIDDEQKGTAYMYINEYRKDYYDYEAAEKNVKVWFKENGGINKIEQSMNGDTLTTKYYRRNELDVYPYKLESIMGTQNQTIYINVEKYDDHGNAIVYTNTCNDVTVRFKRNIEYY